MPPTSTRSPLLHQALRTTLGVILAGLVLMSSGCAAGSQMFEDLNGALKGRPGVMKTYNEESQLIDEVRGVSFSFHRDTTFDTYNSEGGSNKDSSVVKVSLGKNTIHHVGSTMIFAEDSITEITSELPTSVRIENSEPGTPWLNNIHESYRNLWRGKAKTLMIRSQNGTPLAVFAGNAVEIFSSDVPKTTVFRVDGELLLVYRADYTVYDTALFSN